MNDLGVAILTKNESAVKTLIYNGVDVNRTDSVGSLPLHYAAYVGDTTMMLVLIDSGADLNAQDTLGLTPLHRAVAALRYDAAELLINKGCDTALKCKFTFKHLLHICAIHNVPNVAYVIITQSVYYVRPASELCSSFVVLDSADSRGCTALHHAAYHGHIEVAELLLKAGINMAAVDKLGRTAMHSMACGGSLGMLAVLREAGASITVRDFHGRTVAHYSAMASQMDLLAALLRIDKNFINARDNDGYTPLHYAVQNGQNVKTIDL
ncbi:ankyrin repeat protein [Cooperia oncophora]